MGGVAIVLITMMASLRWGYPYLLHSAAKMDVSLPMGTAIIMLAIAALFCALVSAIQLAVSTYARSPREAQQFASRPSTSSMVLPVARGRSLWGTGPTRPGRTSCRS